MGSAPTQKSAELRGEQHEAASIFSRRSDSCEDPVTFSSMTLESRVPPFWVPDRPTCLQGAMQLAGPVTATR